MEENEDNKCPICLENIIEPINYTCYAQHSVCFKCLLKNVSNSDNIKCPLCRGGNSYIILLNKNYNDKYIKSDNETKLKCVNKIADMNEMKENFESIDFFLSCIYYINKLLCIELDNISIISFNILKTYVLNKNQFIMAKFCENMYDKEIIYELIKWKNINSSIKNIPIYTYAGSENLNNSNSIFSQYTDMNNNRANNNSNNNSTTGTSNNDERSRNERLIETISSLFRPSLFAGENNELNSVNRQENDDYNYLNNRFNVSIRATTFFY